MKLPELEQSMLRAARESLGPSAQDRGRHEALLSRLDVAAPSSPISRPVPWGGSRGALGVSGVLAKVAPHAALGRVELVSIGLAVGVVLGGVVGFVLGRADRSHVEDAASTLPAAAQLGARDVATDEHAAAAISEGVRDEVAAVLPGVEDGATGRASGAADSSGAVDSSGSAYERPMRRAAPTKRPKPESSLAIELAMLQRARRALNADNGRLALGIVKELDERFPRGVLLEERSATRVLSLCLLGRIEEAQHFGSEFLARHASSVYAERVRASCAVERR